MDNTNIHIFLHYPDVCLCVYTYLHAIPRNLVSSAYSICLVQEKLKGVRIHMEGVSSFKFLKFSLHLSGVFCLFICCILLKQSIAGCLGNIKLWWQRISSGSVYTSGEKVRKLGMIQQFIIQPSVTGENNPWSYKLNCWVGLCEPLVIKTTQAV